MPAQLRGTYTLSWSAAELRAAAVDHYQAAYGAPLDARSSARLAQISTELAGDYVLSLTDNAYTITDGAGREWCTGTVTVPSERPDRLLLGAVRGSGCVDFHFAEIGWRVEGDQLVLPPDEYRGADVDRLLWTTKPLTRMD